jgi:hypothetical protein
VGLYIQNTRNFWELNSQQQYRYIELHLPDQEYPEALRDRITALYEYLHQLTSVAVVFVDAHMELFEDTFVRWVLADENPCQVEWPSLRQLAV